MHSPVANRLLTSEKYQKNTDPVVASTEWPELAASERRVVGFTKRVFAGAPQVVSRADVGQQTFYG